MGGAEFETAAEADFVAKQLRASGQRAAVTPASSEVAPRYRVCVGALLSYEEASLTADRLNHTFKGAEVIGCETDRFSGFVQGPEASE